MITRQFSAALIRLKHSLSTSGIVHADPQLILAGRRIGWNRQYLNVSDVVIRLP